MAQRDREQRLARAEKLAGVHEPEKGNPLAHWYEDPGWVLPDEITGGSNISVLVDPRGPESPDVPYEVYATEYRHRNGAEFSEMGIEPAAVERLTRYSYEMSLAWKRYVAPEPTPKAPAPKPQTVETVDAPEQVALDDEIRF